MSAQGSNEAPATQRGQVVLVLGTTGVVRKSLHDDIKRLLVAFAAVRPSSYYVMAQNLNLACMEPSGRALFMQTLYDSLLGVNIKLTFHLYGLLHEVQAESVRKKCHQATYVFHRLREDNAFMFVAHSPAEQLENQANQANLQIHNELEDIENEVSSDLPHVVKEPDLQVLDADLQAYAALKQTLDPVLIARAVRERNMTITTELRMQKEVRSLAAVTPQAAQTLRDIDARYTREKTSALGDRQEDAT
ncbi:hypothetical protein HK102_013358 [Quaeritorhiza haematococci]|nr:hypothetical protein HK102_013358 [Quaeritorhiza haematococci]